MIAALLGLVLFLTMTAAKCRFFLTATRRMKGAAAAQMILEAATPK